MEYNDTNRGTVQAPERAHQFISFEGLTFGTISPTDVDGMIEHRGAYVFFEWKLAGKDLPRGQELALTRLVDDLRRARRHAVLFVCEHTVKDPREDVRGADSIVRRVYWDGRWHSGTGKTVREMTRRFMAFAEACGS